MLGLNELHLMAAAARATSVDTALGTIDANMADLISTIGTIGISIGGIAAIALLTGGAVTILTSAGNPDKLMDGRSMIQNALMGLALVVLALFVLQLIGWDILGLGSLGGLGSSYNVNFNSWTP